VNSFTAINDETARSLGKIQRSMYRAQNYYMLDDIAEARTYMLSAVEEACILLNSLLSNEDIPSAFAGPATPLDDLLSDNDQFKRFLQMEFHVLIAVGYEPTRADELISNLVATRPKLPTPSVAPNYDEFREAVSALRYLVCGRAREMVQVGTTRKIWGRLLKAISEGVGAVITIVGNAFNSTALGPHFTSLSMSIGGGLVVTAVGELHGLCRSLDEETGERSDVSRLPKSRYSIENSPQFLELLERHDQAERRAREAVQKNLRVEKSAKEPKAQRKRQKYEQ